MSTTIYFVNGDKLEVDEPLEVVHSALSRGAWGQVMSDSDPVIVRADSVMYIRSTGSKEGVV